MNSEPFGAVPLAAFSGGENADIGVAVSATASAHITTRNIVGLPRGSRPPIGRWVNDSVLHCQQNVVNSER